VQIWRRIGGKSLYKLDKSRCFGMGIKDIPMIATYPKSFDFVDHGLNLSVFYYGQLPKVAPGEIDDPRLSALLKHLSYKNKSVVYCSLGTITFHDLWVCHNFFKRMVEVAVRNPQWYILLNVGNHYDINNLPVTPENLSVFTYVPQRQLLNWVDIMINHGGINSIKECISATVPMIIYPLSLKWDQPGCAARVAYHKIGTIGNIRKDNANTISAKISFLIEHLDEYKNNIRNMNNKIVIVNRSENKKLLSLIQHGVNNKISTKPSFS
jgi:UDP:flavonoid glycosyltransferase YjiC (YdhE family)